MIWKTVFDELKQGIKETSKYIFSHHQPEEYYKCYSLKMKNNKIYFCSRCLGIYFGIFLGILSHHLEIFNEFIIYVAIAIFPFFTIVDWTISAFNIHKSHNFLRTFFGILLGIAYSYGMILFFTKFPNYYVIVIGLFYIMISLSLLFYKNRL